MIRSILYKELRQHWWAFLLIGIICGLGYLGLVASAARVGTQGSTFTVLRLFSVYICLAAVVLGNRLVVSEYHAQTQLFLEALPLPRRRIALIKYFLGLVTVTFIAATAFAITLLMGLRTEVLTWNFIFFLILRFGAFCFFSYSLIFLFGFLGRYRIAFVIVVIIGTRIFSDHVSFEIVDLYPLKMIGPTFAFERENFPLNPFLITIGLGFIFLLMSLGLATIREGSVAALLGEKMSHREKITVAILLMGSMFGGYLLDEHKPKEAYRLHGAATSSAPSKGIQVSVSPDSTEGQILADKLREDMEALGEYLGIKSLPPVFVIHRADLDPDLHERGFLNKREGVVLRTNFSSQEWSYEHFVEKLVGQLLRVHSNRRLLKEDRFWILDGFTLFWARRSDESTVSTDVEETLNASPDLLLRALYGTRDRSPFTPSDMRRWVLLQDELGHEITAGIAWSVLRVLESTAGPEKCRAFLQSILAVDSPKGIATSLRDLFSPPEQHFRDHAGLSLEEFLPVWRRELEGLRSGNEEQLNALPRISGELNFNELSRDSLVAHYSLLEPANVSPEQKARLVYASLKPFEHGVSESLLIPVPLGLNTDSRSGILPDDFPRGTRLLYTFRIYSKKLNCHIVSGWQRKEAR